MKIKRLHFAWDDPNNNLEEKFRRFAKKFKRRTNIGTVYCLTNFENVSVEEHIERALMRIYLLRDLGFDPYCMVYNKPSAPKEIRHLQRWCNNMIIFKTVPDFRNYQNIG